MATLLVGSTVGGYVTGHLGRRLDPATARLAITILNAAIVALVFWRKFA